MRRGLLAALLLMSIGAGAAPPPGPTLDDALRVIGERYGCAWSEEDRATMGEAVRKLATSSPLSLQDVLRALRDLLAKKHGAGETIPPVPDLVAVLENQITLNVALATW